jgi:L-ascorbate metabolism protein UlaG (beta-lactamase superfamily)
MVLQTLVPDQNMGLFDMQFKDLTRADKPKYCFRTVMRHAAISFLLFFGMVSSLTADITLTQLANEGVMITDGQTLILIDGMVVEPYSVYGGLPPETIPLFEQVSGPFSGVDLVLASHRHHDHNQPQYACQFMQNSSGTKFVSSSQVIGLMREKCRTFMTTSPRVTEINPQYGEPHVFQLKTARVTVFPLSHGTRKYARIQNYGHLVEIGDMTVLHIGDAAMDPTDFARAGLDKMEIDVVLIPFWFFQPGPGSQVVTEFLDAPNKIAMHIPPGEMQEVTSYMSEDFPEVTILQTPLDQARFSATVQPPP